MRINEIKELSEKDVINACRKISIQCSEFISEMKKTQSFLYRGVDYSIDAQPIFIANSPKDRKPTGQTQREQYILDMMLALEGFEALRSNSVSCSSVLSEIMRFGRPYMIFPINGFAFTWSEIINDIGSDGDLNMELGECDKDYTFDIRENKKKITDCGISEFIKNCKFQNGNMQAALQSGNEISVHGRYFAISRYYIDIVSDYFKIVEGT